MSDSKTALVIGGGVIGLSTAYHLARKKFGRVILLEKEKVGDGASSRAGGIITGLLWTETGVEARKISLARYQDLSEELKEFGYRFENVGCLNLFDNLSWQERLPLLPLYDRHAVPYETLNPAEIRYRWPQLTPSEDLIGLYDPLGGYSEPDDYLPALAAGCRAQGVDIREGEMVERILVKNGEVGGVETKSGSIWADVVICTVHSWTLQLLSSIDWHPPIKSFVHQRYVSTRLEKPAEIPAINANPYEGYIRPAAGQRLLAGGETPERIPFKVPSLDYRMDGLAPPPDLERHLFENMLRLYPELSNSKWDSSHIGLLSFSLDEEPILGEAPHIKNLFIGVSFHSGGFAYNPAAGLLLAELVNDKKTQINIDAFSPARFNPQEANRFSIEPFEESSKTQRRH